MQEYIEKMSKIHKSILSFIENDDSTEEFEKLIHIFHDLEIQNNMHTLKLLLYIIVNIADNHQRGPNFFVKIQKILEVLKIKIKENFSNFSIFNIFKSNKRILLFLIKEQIMILDKTIIFLLTTKYEFVHSFYPEYLFSSIKPFMSDVAVQRIEESLPDNYKEKQEIGENDNYICKLIRDDLIDDFVAFVKEKNLSLNSKIKKSFFETNSFLINQQVSLIEYAAFFGSVQIFKYLQRNKIKLTPSLWLHAIHGKNIEIIHLLEESNVKPEEKKFTECFYEAIKCHHNEIMDYIGNNYKVKEYKKPDYSFIQCLKCYNISFMNSNSVNESSFFYFCQYDYFHFVDNLLKHKNININKKTIYI